VFVAFAQTTSGPVIRGSVSAQGAWAAIRNSGVVRKMARSAMRINRWNIWMDFDRLFRFLLYLIQRLKLQQIGCI
jgi:hypothetical protein